MQPPRTILTAQTSTSDNVTNAPHALRSQAAYITRDYVLGKPTKRDMALSTASPLLRTTYVAYCHKVVFGMHAVGVLGQKSTNS